MRQPFSASSEVAWFFTHADGTTSTMGTWKLAWQRDSDVEDLGGVFFSECINEDVVGECGGKSFSPVVAAEVVHAGLVLRAWKKDPVLRAYCREYAYKQGMALVLCETEVERGGDDVLAMEDAELRKKGYRLL